jgi:hypothetical protein
MAEITTGALVQVDNLPGFQTSDGTLTDPSTVTFRWRINDGAETVWVYGTDVQLVKDSTGKYHVDVQTTTVGVYSYRWEGTGALVATSEGSFTVTSSYPAAAAATVGAYADLATFRNYLRVGAQGPNTTGNDSNDPDSALEVLALQAAARAIDNACGRTFNGPQTAASSRYYTPRWIRGIHGSFGRYICEVDDISDYSDVVVKFDATGNGNYDNTITTYRMGPRDNPSRGLPYDRLIFDIGTWIYVRGEEAVEVTTANWGWATVPPVIVNANLLQAARYLKRRDAAFGVTESPTVTTQTRLLSKLDPDVELMLQPPYRRMLVA